MVIQMSVEFVTGTGAVVNGSMVQRIGQIGPEQGGLLFNPDSIHHPGQLCSSLRTTLSLVLQANLDMQKVSFRTET
jgi:hypothetical protein